ncbi:hypothetical protein [Streptomyces spirodelae]|uniref:Cytochrome P450 n=1 Tax=Streptomyces spirodelae TaxID=2812904 RepID=A0ABS3WTD6_9ACTN|nr:hypothetical protein [Streptomyces spirodelae]MBO8186386.1 hypothetical protein [Streptomyces spirodelae]
MATSKRRAPGDDVTSRLCATDGVGDDEIAMLPMALLFAGHETTVVQIGLGALLLTDPGQWQAMLADPGLVPDAVEEILRAPGKAGGGIPRYAHTDITRQAAARLSFGHGARYCLGVLPGPHGTAGCPRSPRRELPDAESGSPHRGTPPARGRTDRRPDRTPGEVVSGETVSTVSRHVFAPFYAKVAGPAVAKAGITTHRERLLP